MKARRLLSILMALVLLAGILPAAADSKGRDGSTDDYCAYSRNGKHNWSDWVVIREATCSSPGLEIRMCMNDCGIEQTREIAKLPHTWGGWTVKREATCSQEGVRAHTCSVCGTTQTETVARKAHTWSDWTVTAAATCSQAGSRTRKCAVCGEVQTEAIAMIAHTWSEWQVSVEATDHSAGQRTRTCSVCGTAQTDTFYPEGTLRRGDNGDAVRALQEGLICYGALAAGSADGSFGPGTEKAVAAVQTAEGFTADGIAWPQTQAVLGHVWSEWQVESELSDFSIGLRRRTCSRCGETEEDRQVPSPMYKRGDKGDGVKQLQKALNAAGYDCGTPDGSFGGKTEAAVKALEAANGITADGIAWPGVLKLLGLVKEELQTAQVDGGLGLPVDTDDFGGDINLTWGGKYISPVLGLLVTPGAVTQNGEDISFAFTVTNVSGIPVNLSYLNSYADYQQPKNDPVYYLEKGGQLVKLTPMEEGIGAASFDANELLEHGESARMEMHTQPADNEHYLFACVTRELYVIADPVQQPKIDEEIPALPPVVGFAVLYCPVGPYLNQLCLLTQGNVTRTGTGADEVVTVEMRLENLTNDIVEIEISEEGHAPFDPQYMWTSLDWTSFKLGAREVKDFTVSMKPTQEELNGWYLWRHVVAYTKNTSYEYSFSQLLNIPLSNYPYGMMEISGGQGKLEGGAYSVPLTATYFPLVKTDYQYLGTCEDVRFAGAVYGPDGSCVDTFTIAPDPHALEPGQSTSATLQYSFTPEQVALGQVTFIIRAEYNSDYFGDKTAGHSWNIYRKTVDLTGLSPYSAQEKPLELTATVREGDQRFRVGDTFNLDVDVSYAGANPIHYLNVNADGWYDGYDSSTTPIPEFVGITFAEGNETKLAPNQTWSFSKELTVPSSAVSEGEFSITVYTTAVDTVTGELYADDVTLVFRCVSEGLDIYAVPDSEYFVPGVPIHVEVTVENTDVQDFESFVCVARYDSPAVVAGKSPHKTLMAERDFAPGQTKTKTFTYTPTEEDAENGYIQVYIYVDGAYPGTYTSNVTNRRSVFFQRAPKAEISLSGPSTPILFSEETYASVQNVSFTITNTGKTPLGDIGMGGKLLSQTGEMICVYYFDFILPEGKTELAPGEFIDYSFDIDTDDLAWEGVYAVDAVFTVAGVSTETGEETYDMCSFEMLAASWAPGDLAIRCFLPGAVKLLGSGDDSSNEDEFIPNGSFTANDVAHVMIMVGNLGETPLGPLTVTAVNADSGEETVVLTVPEGLEPLGLDNQEPIETVYDYTVTIQDYLAGGALLRIEATTEGTDTAEGQYAWAMVPVVTAPMEASTTGLFFLPVGEEEEKDTAMLLIDAVPTVNGGGVDDTIDYEVTVTNNGEASLYKLFVNAAQWTETYEYLGGDNLLMRQEPDFLFAPGESVTLKYTYTVDEDDAVRGYVIFDFDAVGYAKTVDESILADCLVRIDLSDEPVEPDPGTVTLTKKVLGKSELPEGYHKGEYINYVITLTNNTTDTTFSAEVLDYCAGALTGETLGTVMLAPGESRDFAFAHLVDDDDVSTGYVDNMATVDIIDIYTGSAIKAGSILQTDTVRVDTTELTPPEPVLQDDYAVRVEKKEISAPLFFPQGYTEGETVTYEITVTNICKSDINAVWIFDDLKEYLDQPEYIATAKLAPGQPISVPYTHQVTADDVARGKIENQGVGRIAVIDVYGNVVDLDYLSDVVTVYTVDWNPNETTREPGTVIRPTPEPTEEPPVTDPPRTEEPPVTDPPRTEEPPVTDPPRTEEPPVTDPPRTEEPPVTDPPRTEEPPVTDPPRTEEPPVTDPPRTEEPPVTDPPRTEEPPVTDPPRTVEPTPVPPTVTDGDCCRRVLIAHGEGEYDYQLLCCAEHQADMDAVQAILNGEITEQSLQEAIALLTADVEREYEDLRERILDEAILEVLETERSCFFSQLEATEAMFAALSDQTTASLYTVDQLLERLIDLCYASHTAPQARLDSLMTPGYALLGADEAPDACQRTLEPAGAGLLSRQSTCAAHRSTDAKLDADLAAATDRAKRAEAFEQARVAWKLARMTLSGSLFRSAGSDSAAAISMDLLAFENWVEARAALLTVLYPDDPATVAELAAATIQRRVMDMEAMLAQP